MSSALVIETTALSKRYRETTALDSLDLQVPKNAIFGFLGPNGAGKSTAMKLLLGLAKPTSGSGTIFGHDIATESTAIRRRIGYLAQEPRFYDPMTARETLRFTARFFGLGGSETEDRIRRTLDLVGLRDKADRAIKGFSGGERQRLGIAQAQINEPDLLILDEPAAALDPMGRRDVLHVMEQLREHTTIFYSTHILEDVQRVSDTVAILDRGRLVAQAPVQTLLASSDATSYTVTFQGAPERARTSLEACPWVTQVVSSRPNGAMTWRIDVNDEQAADKALLPLMISEGLTIKEFGRAKKSLEDIFVDLIEGESSKGERHDD